MVEKRTVWWCEDLESGARDRIPADELATEPLPTVTETVTDTLSNLSAAGPCTQATQAQAHRGLGRAMDRGAVGRGSGLPCGQRAACESPGSASSLSRWCTEDRAKYGLDGWCLHEFRHTYLTLLAIQGVHPKVMQELAEHYSSQISMDTYTHVNMDSKRQAVDIVSAVF